MQFLSLSDLRQYKRDLKLSRRVHQKNPKAAKGTILFAAIGPDKFKLRGKGPMSEYLPVLCSALRQIGYRTQMTAVPRIAKRVASDQRTVAVVNLLHEENDREIDPRYDALVLGASNLVVFNSIPTCRIIADKARTNELFATKGIRTPRTSGYGGKSFSIPKSGSGSEVEVSDSHGSTHADRFVSEFIDTRLSYNGNEYYTMVRLMSVGKRIVAAFPAARSVSDGNYSVHGYDTPLERGLIGYLKKTLIDDIIDRHNLISQQIGEVLGPGFYHHDLIVERETRDVYLAETGLKFFADSFASHIEPIKKGSPLPEALHDYRVFARIAADYIDQEISDRCVKQG